MRKYIDENDKKNEIRLLFKHPSYKNIVIVVVEGKSDIRLFRSLLQHERLRIESVDGKKELIKVMKDLVKELPKKLVAICDADFDHLRKKSKTREEYSVYVTDMHDAEMLMLNSPSFQAFVDEYSSVENIEILREEALSVALKSSYTLGLLRWISFQEGLNINFKGLNYSEFIDVSRVTISLDIDVLVDKLIKRSKSFPVGISKEVVLGFVKSYQQQEECKFQVCNGHDTTNVLALIYRQKWASLETNMDSDKIETALRLGYEKQYFAGTALCENIRNALELIGVSITGVNKEARA